MKGIEKGEILRSFVLMFFGFELYNFYGRIVFDRIFRRKFLDLKDKRIKYSWVY